MIEVAENTNLVLHPNVLLSVETELKRLRKNGDV
jgi:hypothetical protein